MNTAAKAINQNNLFNGQLSKMRLSKQFYFILIILIAILGNALAVVYVINEYRSNFSQLQQLKSEHHQLQLQWGQLLLEQASLATPARVEAIALEKLHMNLPQDKQTFILSLK
jgi:cell division protein FtsL